MKTKGACWQLAVLLAVTLECSVPGSVWGALFVVNKETDDNGPCSLDDCALREAVLAADALPGADVVHIPPGTYELTLGREDPNFFSGEIDIEDDVEIIAPSGAVVVGSGTSDRPIFYIHDAATVRLEGLTVTGGRYCCGAAFWILGADVVLDQCWITGNEGTVDSGGIEFGPGRLEIVNSTISGNTALRRGGAIQRTSFGSTAPAFLIIRNSTISGNSAREGGAISSFGGGGDIRIENSTIAGNPVRNFGSVIFVFSGKKPTFVNSVLEGDCSYAGQLPISEGGNVDGPGETFCNLDHPTDLPAQPNLGLLPLGEYGGPTPTHALSPASPAVDRALASACPDADQRGEPRPVDGDGDGIAQCDAGAVELQDAVADIPALSLVMALLLAALLAVAGTSALRGT
jgi:CSLREA domain-containing protein